MSQVGGINVYDQLLVRTLHDVAHTIVLVAFPSLLAASFKNSSEIAGLLFYFYHVRIQSGKEEDVVDEA